MNSNKLLTPEDLSEQLQVSVGTIYNWINKKRIPYQKICGAVRFDQKKIDNWIDQRTVRAKIGGMTLKTAS